ncbi:HdeD family acid-resistance protein [Bdellovibrio sp. HCB337]|uniref:HdeD family acid-resistance protein n=1 Tax=Bdellovibrio sp. HCB337 TaxID=3394358 RepID=UPI0039A40FED
MNAIYYGEGRRSVSSRLIFLGSVFVLLGILALAFASATTLTAMFVLGVLLVCAGAAEIIYGFQNRSEGQLWPHLGFGCLALICGALIFLNPVENVLGFTLIISFLLIASGLAKVVGAAAERFFGWGWVAANGVASIILGAMVLRYFPVSAFWTIGVFVGVDFIIAGATLIGLGSSMKRAKRELAGQVRSTLGPEPTSRKTEREEHPFH